MGIEDNIYEAEIIAENEISSMVGPLFHRKDIGTGAAIQKRIIHMNSIR